MTSLAEIPEPKRPFAFGYGALPLMLVLPPLVWWMWWCMVEHGGNMVPPTLDMLRQIPWPTTTSIGLYLGWFAFQALLQVAAPGPWVEGATLTDGSRLLYKMNGWFSWWLTWAVVAVAVWRGWLSATVLYDHFGPLYWTVTLFAFAYSLFLYLHGRLRPDEGKSKWSGHFFYDYFMGTALNPRTGSFDHKLFNEARPGLILWVAINLSIAAKQYQTTGAVSWPMIAVGFFHFWYVADYYFHEEAILSTWDIRHENFGWMLCWGDLAWVPFSYTLQALYLLTHPHPIPDWAVIPIAVLNFAGFAIFRGANIQKHNFRKDPEKPIWGQKPEYILTQKGTTLLVSGFWGIGRHLNYLGDLMMGLAWCLVSGFHNVLPYFYIIYFTILLVHRERRDHVHCAAKYGADWDRYCEKVRWRILPGIY